MGSVDDFLAARELLLRHRGDYDAARREFRWPELEDFDWALDYFDRIAVGNDARALWVIHEDGSQDVRTFAELSLRSNPTCVPRSRCRGDGR